MLTSTLLQVQTAGLVVASPRPWLGLEEEEVGRQVGQWQEEVDLAARTMVQHLGPNTSSLTSQGAGGVVLELVVVGKEEEEEEHRFADEGAELYLTLEHEEQKEEKLIVFKSYQNLGCILNRQESCSTASVEEGNGTANVDEGGEVKEGGGGSVGVVGERRVNSRVVGADMYLGSQRREVNTGLTVTITFRHMYGNEQVKGTHFYRIKGNINIYFFSFFFG